MLKEFLARMREKRARFNSMKEDGRFQELIEQRKKNANERELERFMEIERQKQIKIQLQRFREKEKAENRRMNILNGKNIFKGHKSVLTNNNKLFSMAPENNMFFKGGL